jgi:hypothetical protein
LKHDRLDDPHDVSFAFCLVGGWNRHGSHSARRIA